MEFNKSSSPGGPTYAEVRGSKIKGTETIIKDKSGKIIEQRAPMFLMARATFHDKTRFRFKLGGNVTIGPQARFRVGGVVKGEINVGSAELVSGHIDIANVEDWDADYLGRDGIYVRQGAALNIKSPFKKVKVLDRVQVGAEWERTFRGHQGTYEEENDEYSVGVGVTVLKNPSGESIKSKSGKSSLLVHTVPLQTSAKAKAHVSTDENFTGVSTDLGIALIIGVDINISIGFEDYE